MKRHIFSHSSRVVYKWVWRVSRRESRSHTRGGTRVSQDVYYNTSHDGRAVGTASPSSIISRDASADPRAAARRV